MVFSILIYIYKLYKVLIIRNDLKILKQEIFIYHGNKTIEHLCLSFFFFQMGTMIPLVPIPQI